MQRSSSIAGSCQLRRWYQWPWVLLLALGLLATGCSQDVSNIGVGLPTANTNTGAYLVDTLTIRSSTVLRDSVVTSNTNSLLVGRYTDPQLGTITAKSFVRLGLTSSFIPDPTAVYDSLTLVLTLDNYRYGDTTKTQSLVEVHRFTDPNNAISATKVSFASPRLTPPPSYSPTLLNYDTIQRKNVAPIARARPTLTSLRLHLDNNLGRQLLAAGQRGQLSTQDALDSYLPGIALTPAPTDDATIIRLSATSSGAGITLYYHLPTDPTTVLSTFFSFAAGNRHFYQVTADRSTAGATSSTNFPQMSLQAVPAALTGQQTFVEGALGLQTRLDFPYLTDIQQYGAHITVTSAQLIAPVPAFSVLQSPFVPAPPPLIVTVADGSNRVQATYLANVPYMSGISSLTGLQQGYYQWSIATYVQQVLNRNVPNNGLLLGSVTSALPDRVVLGSAQNKDSKLQLQLYFITVK
ncbi:DUF4270 family protein [Hymenobacter baengnokdamensis]|uniref:DUF4270 family protein n=1 Tax=Hymenobacter baengnokdamensis TaxID=2615203 RepID=UPI001E5BFB8F|nr:DUF4270 family protein [Hymenobacter baengnokdamensis]